MCFQISSFDNLEMLKFLYYLGHFSWFRISLLKNCLKCLLKGIFFTPYCFFNWKSFKVRKKLNIKEKLHKPVFEFWSGKSGQWLEQRSKCLYRHQANVQFHIHPLDRMIQLLQVFHYTLWDLQNLPRTLNTSIDNFVSLYPQYYKAWIDSLLSSSTKIKVCGYNLLVLVVVIGYAFV